MERLSSVLNIVNFKIQLVTISFYFTKEQCIANIGMSRALQC